MERLTYDCCFGDIHCWQVKGADNLECRQVCEEQGENGCKGCPIALAFDRLAAYEDTGLTPEEVQQMRWIPVEERLPSVNDLVLVFSKDDEYGHTQHELAKYMFHPTLGWDWCTFDNEYYEWLPAFNRITHWMPLPKAPKEGKND